MSSRKGLISQVYNRIDPIPEPNRHIPMISADCRVYFPPNATRQQILNTVTEALDDLIRKIEAQDLPRTPKNLMAPQMGVRDVHLP